MNETKLKIYGSEKFNPEQIMRFEKYVDSKYPMLHFRKRRQYAKAVLKETNKQLIIKHIYPGEKIWASSPTLAKRLVRWVKNSAVRLSANIKELKHKGLLQLLKPWNLTKENVKHLVGQAPDIIGVKDDHGGQRTITGILAKAFHLMNRLLSTLGLSLRLNPSGFAVGILKIKPKLQHREGNCLICGNKLGHWYRLEQDMILYPWPRTNAKYNTIVIGGVHYLCELPTDKEGVLL